MYGENIALILSLIADRSSLFAQPDLSLAKSEQRTAISEHQEVF